MDIVSALIEDNINKAREINTILEGNEEQLQHIEKDTINIKQNNYYANRVLDYFNSWYTYLKPKFFKEEKTVNMSIPNITITDTDIKNLDNMEKLKELTNKITCMLDQQNESLSALTEDIDTNNLRIQRNQNKIKQLL